MFIEESERVAAVISTFIPREHISNVLDVGSSSYEFRTVVQPHIEKNLFEPLKRAGCTVKHLDIKMADGVDISVDLSNPKEFSFPLETFSLILCTNILEHVQNREVFLKNLLKFAEKGAYVLFTVPRKYFKHDDPIDTMYRPTPQELSRSLLSVCSFKTLHEEILTVQSERYYLIKAKPFRSFPFQYQMYSWRRYSNAFRWKVSLLLIRIK